MAEKSFGKLARNEQINYKVTAVASQKSRIEEIE